MLVKEWLPSKFQQGKPISRLQNYQF
uniref:Uncharacterized protein n=1 Tax=Arundo donax TaxID=35708 RepID=A0A0A8ZQ53_ARUDO